MSTRILDTINNKIGTFTGASAAPTPGSSSATVTAEMTTAEIHDSTDTLRLGVEADFGAGFRHMAWSPLWTGGPTQVAPKVTWTFDPNNPPRRVRGVLENITQCVAGLKIDFA